MLASMELMRPAQPRHQCRTRSPQMLASTGNVSRNNRGMASSNDEMSNTAGLGQQWRDRLRTKLGIGGLLTITGGGAAVLAATRRRTRPVVIIHGVLSNRLWFEEVADWVHAALGKGAYVRAVEVGNGEVRRARPPTSHSPIQTRCAPQRTQPTQARVTRLCLFVVVGRWKVDSITRPMEWQLAELARVIQADKQLRRGFNIIAHSQGTLLARAFVQRFDWPPVHVLVSWVGPQAGQFGVPTYEPLLGYLNRVTSGMWYTPQLQSSRSSSRTLSFANYWRDPTKLDVYLANSGFLADINNEREKKNASYATRLARLEHFVLVYSSSDSIIQPAVSSWFGFYKDNSTDELEPLASRQMYKEDWIGLRTLDTTGRLHFAQIDCLHIEVPTASCKRDVWDRTTRAFLAPSVCRLHARRAACTPHAQYATQSSPPTQSVVLQNRARRIRCTTPLLARV